LPGGSVKNLFLRQPRRRCDVAGVAEEDRALDLRRWGRRSVRRPSFGSPERLMALSAWCRGGDAAGLINDRAQAVRP